MTIQEFKTVIETEAKPIILDLMKLENSRLAADVATGVAELLAALSNACKAKE